MTDLLWIAFAYLCGALPLSYWIGEVFLRVDIRTYGDGNPGGANVWKAGGKWWGITAILADAFKGLIPVALAHFWGGVAGWPLAAVGIAPVFPWQAPVVLGLAFLVWLKTLRVEGWAVTAGMATLLLYLLIFDRDPVLLAVWLVNTLVFVVKHRDDFRRPPDLANGWLGRFVRKT